MKNTLQTTSLSFLLLLLFSFTGQALAENYTLSATTLPVTEGDPMTFSVTVDPQPFNGDSIEISYTVTPVTATEGDDYTSVTPSPLVYDGVLPVTQSFNVDTTDDPIFEGIETVRVEYTVTCNDGATPCTYTWSTPSGVDGIINNNDYQITSPGDVTVDERDGFANFNIAIDRIPSGSDVVRVDYSTEDDTALNPLDYTTTTGDVTFTSSSLETFQVVSIPITNDIIREYNGSYSPPDTEQFRVRLVTGSPTIAETPTDNTGLVTIVDDDIYYITSNLADTTVQEYSGSLTFRIEINRTPDPGMAVIVNYQTIGGTAVPTEDFISTTGFITFTDNPSAPLFQDVTIPIVDDTVREYRPAASPTNSELFNFTISAGSINTEIPTNYNALITILDDDLYQVSTDLADTTVLEDEGPVTFRIEINRTPNPGATVTVDYTTIPGTATAIEDYTHTSGTLTFTDDPSAPLYQDVSIPITDDRIREFDVSASPNDLERFRFSVSVSSANADAPVANNVEITIDDNDYDISLSPDFSVDVDAGVANVQIIVTPAIESGNPININYETSDLTATAGDDYEDILPTAVTLTDASSNPLVVPVTILNDGGIGDETFTFDLFGFPVNATYVDDQSVITIADHDFEIDAGGGATVLEDAGTVDIPISIDRDPIGSEQVSVSYTTADDTALVDSDYTLTSDVLVFTSLTGRTINVTVPILDDTVFEPLETFTVDLSANSPNAAIADAQAVVAINDNDYLVTAISDVTVAESAGNALVTVQLNRDVVPGDSVVIDVSTIQGTALEGIGNDYLDPSGTLTIAENTDRATISIPILDDALVEEPETFSVYIAAHTPDPNVEIPDPEATVTIDMDEQYSLAIDDVSLAEADGTMEFTVSITPPLQSEHDGLVVNFATGDDSAVAPGDYIAELSGTITFSAGDASELLPVTINEDTVNEGASERFYVNLTGSSIPDIVSFADNQGVGLILDTDYAITPTWNIHGAVSLQSPLGTPVALINGSPAAIANLSQSRFTVQADYGIHSVLVNGVNPATLGFVTVNIINDTEHTYTFEPSTPQGLHAIDVLFDHQVLVTATGDGTITRTSHSPNTAVHNSGPTSVVASHDEDQIYLIQADSGFCVGDLIVDGLALGGYSGLNTNYSSESYTIANVVDDHTIEAEFTNATITVIVGADDGATGTSDDLFIQDNSQSGSGWRAFRTDASYNPIGAAFMTGVHNETISIPNDTPCDSQFILIEFLNVDGWLKPADIQINLQDNMVDQTVEGLYDANSHVLTIISTHGLVNRDPEGELFVSVNRYLYQADTTVDLTASSDPGWYFALWQGDAAGTDPVVNITMDRDMVVTAVFVEPCQDADLDGYTVSDSGTGCTASTSLDCNDFNEDIFPGATEICGDGIDQDCSGSDLTCGGDDTDDDGDGYTENEGDCDDTSTGIGPGLYDDPRTTTIDEDCYDGPKVAGLELTCVSPSDVPAGAARKPAAPLIMFLLDDSGSMDWEFMVRSGSNQLFEGRYYVYNYDVLQRAYGNTSLEDWRRNRWMSQWSGHNRIFFNPTVTYTPWPKWDVIVGPANLRVHERGYDPTIGSFPDTAYKIGYVHADMDFPRLNTHDASATINSMYHPGGTGTVYDMELDAEFMRVRSVGQQVMVTRDSGSSGSSTYADAIGLSTRNDLELTVGHPWTWYTAANQPEIIFDTDSGIDIYSESGTWNESGGGAEWEWGDSGRYTTSTDRSASWRLNLTAAEAGSYYLYAWVDDYGSRDDSANYAVFSYNGSNLESDTFRRDQSPTNTTTTPEFGARWVRISDTPYDLVEQSGSSEIIIPNAHYYTFNDLNADDIRDTGEDVYLVIISGSGHAVGNYALEYYRFMDLNSNDAVDDGELVQVTGTDIPTAVIPVRFDVEGDPVTNADQLAYMVRQDFADWFSFYRRRILTAKAAIGLTVDDMEQVELGVHTINRSYHVPLVFMEEAESPQKTTYLTTIYNIRPVGSTPLRRGLDDVGRYFNTGDTGDYTNLQTSEGLNNGTCSGDTSVFWDARQDSDADDCADSGGECQRSYVIAMTDGYYNGSFSGLNNIDGAGAYSPIFRDSANNSLSDISMRYYDTDLDAGLANNLPGRGFDENFSQHLVTYTVSFGVFGYFDPTLFPDCLPGCEPGVDGCPEVADLSVENWTETAGQAVFTGAGPYLNACPDWHNGIFTNSPKSVDDLFHASVNSRGKFLNAADPGELVSAMTTIKELIAEQTGTASTVAVNANRITENTLVYQTLYNSEDWSGDVLAKCLDSDGKLASCERVTCENTCRASYDTCLAACTVGDSDCEGVCETGFENCITSSNCDGYQTCDEAYTSCIETASGNAAQEATCSLNRSTCRENPPEVKWSANTGLEPRAYTGRQILTADHTGAGLPFQWSTLPGPMKTELLGDELVLNFIRGQRDYEDLNDTLAVRSFRNRSSKLGDFVNSEPLYYSNTTINIEWVFVGGNDGMLHVFDSNTGEEIFAFIPYTVFGNLYHLTEDTYNDNHTYFVDGQLTVRTLNNRVILVGGLGKGGKGYFALDLTAAAANRTDIEAHAAEIVLWEYSTLTNPTDPAITGYLGYTFSQPGFYKSNDASADWLLVFGNGYDSTSERAALFAVGLDGNGAIQWTRVIDTGVGGSGTDCNGLSSPALIYSQGDGHDDFAYAGDLLGNLWKFDLGAASNASWKVYFENTSGVPQPLFTATSDAGYRQPITVEPDITTSCAVGASGYFIVFGTGRMLDPDVDFLDQSVQTIYGVWDWANVWEAEGTAPDGTYLGSFLPEDTSASGSCLASCSSILGDATTSGTCVYNCLGDTTCIDTCNKDYLTCTEGCTSIRNLSNMDTITGAASGDYITLLRQTQVWAGGLNFNSDGTVRDQVYGVTDLNQYDEIVRALSARQPDWFLPSKSTDFAANGNKTAKHVGWYFDLPTNGERLVRDPQIAWDILFYTTSIPSDSPCESGGMSYNWFLNVCSGGRLPAPIIELGPPTNPGGGNTGVPPTYIQIGPPGSGIFIPPSSYQSSGLGPGTKVLESEHGGGVTGTPDQDGGLDMREMGYPGIPIKYWQERNWQ